MRVVRETLATGVSAATAGRRRQARMVVVALVASAAVAMGVVVSRITPATADTGAISAAQAQAAALADQIASEASQVHQLSQNYGTAQDRVGALDQQMAADQAALARSQLQMGVAQAQLRQEAVAAYVDGGTSGGLAALLSQRPDTFAVSRVYLEVTAGNASDAIDGFRTARRTFEGRQAVLASTQRQALEVSQAILGLRQALQSKLGHEAATLNQVKGQLAQLVAQDQAAQAAKAQAAQAAQAQAAAQSQALVQRVEAQAAMVAQAQTPSLPQGLPLSSSLVVLAASPRQGPVPSSGGGAFAALRACESGGNYSADTGNGYFGAYQFSAATWNALGYPGLPSQASAAEQDQAAAVLQARSGWGQWPTCSAMLGLG